MISVHAELRSARTRGQSDGGRDGASTLQLAHLIGGGSFLDSLWYNSSLYYERSDRRSTKIAEGREGQYSLREELDAAKEYKAMAQPIAVAAREKATHLHQLRVALRAERLAGFSKGSAKWQLFNCLSPATPRRKPKAGGKGQGAAAPAPAETQER